MAGKKLEDIITKETKETKENSKENSVRNPLEDLAYLGSVASNPNEKLIIGKNILNTTYGLEALKRVYERADKGSQYYIGPPFKAAIIDYNQNREFSPQSKNMFKFYDELFAGLLNEIQAKELCNIIKIFGSDISADAITKLLDTDKSVKELKEEYSEKKEKGGYKDELVADSVLGTIDALTEVIKTKAKVRLWDKTIEKQVLAPYKETADNVDKILEIKRKELEEQKEEYQKNINSINEQLARYNEQLARYN